MDKPHMAWGALLEALSILHMTARYTQSNHIPEEQYMIFKDTVRSVMSNEAASGAARGIASAMYDICPHGEQKSQVCKRCQEQAFAEV